MDGDEGWQELSLAGGGREGDKGGRGCHDGGDSSSSCCMGKAAADAVLTPSCVNSRLMSHPKLLHPTTAVFLAGDRPSYPTCASAPPPRPSHWASHTKALCTRLALLPLVTVITVTSGSDASPSSNF